MPAFYASGSLPAAGQYLPRIECATPNRLLSLHSDYLSTARKWLQQIESARDPHDMSIMFDSGAFTAWSKGEEQPKVDNLLRTYTSALKFCEPRFKEVWFISLDVIPGSKGSGSVTQAQIDEATKQSDINHHILAKELGNRVLPVFHQTEPLSRLDEVVALNPEYVCLSPRQGEGFVDRERRQWAQRVHAYLGGRTTTHGLASTGGRMMLEVPWRSVDSATWLLASAYGALMLPVGNEIKIIAVSEHNAAKRFWGRHADTATPAVLRMIEAISDQIEVTMHELRTHFGARILFNISALANLSAREHTPVPVPLTLFAP